MRKNIKQGKTIKNFDFVDFVYFLYRENIHYSTFQKFFFINSKTFLYWMYKRKIPIYCKTFVYIYCFMKDNQLLNDYKNFMLHLYLKWQNLKMSSFCFKYFFYKHRVNYDDFIRLFNINPHTFYNWIYKKKDVPFYAKIYILTYFFVAQKKMLKVLFKYHEDFIYPNIEEEFSIKK